MNNLKLLPLITILLGASISIISLMLNKQSDVLIKDGIVVQAIVENKFENKSYATHVYQKNYKIILALESAQIKFNWSTTKKNFKTREF